MSDTNLELPADLSASTDEDLQGLESNLVNAFDSLRDSGNVTPDSLRQLRRYAEDINSVRGELAARAETAQANEQALAELTSQVHGDESQAQETEEPTETDEGEGPPGPGERPDEEGVEHQSPAPDLESVAAAAAQGTASALLEALGDRLQGEARSRTATIAQVRQHAPTDTPPSQDDTRRPLVVTAGAEIPNIARGAPLEDLTSLSDAFHQRARRMPITRSYRPGEDVGGSLVATLHNDTDVEHVIDGERTPPNEVEQLWKDLTKPPNAEALLAAGGWCAPSETRYDFFNVACESGLVDLPTVGVRRGGIEFPTSPSLADVFSSGNGTAFGGFSTTFNNTSVPWLWTEADDIDAVTGSGVKPCVRIPCPDFSERRLELYGLCVTAGNLADDAYPEATSNFLRLVQAAHSHAVNGRLIATMVSLSSPAATGGTGVFGSNHSISVDLLDSLALAAVDYRARYGMCEDDVLEVVLPYWVTDVIRGDYSRRTGVTEMAITNAMINSWFTSRRVRVQYVNDWQVRTGDFPGQATVRTEWPASVTFMMYAAGTFLHGTGMTLDLGVVRDSVLNEKNDHTAAWSEEAHLIARVGHESRLYTVDICNAGRTGAADIICT